MKILTSPIVLLFVLVPFLGLSQSARKINKTLKSDYAVQVKMYDSLMFLHDSIIPIYAIQLKQYKSIQLEKENQINMLFDKKRDVTRVFRALFQLGLDKSLSFTPQSLDSISIPGKIERIQTLKTSKGIPRKEWGLSLDKLSIKEQNESLSLITNEIKQMNSMVIQTNLELIELMPKLKEKQQELEVLAVSINSIDVLLTQKLTYLLEQKELAKNNFSAKGPRGFNKSYFVVFPEVFPIPDEVVEVYESYGDEMFSVPVEKMKEPQVKQEGPEIFTFVDEPASFNGDVKKYLAENIVYPKTAVELGIEGRCYLQFIVSDNGNISNISLKRGVPDCPECDKEAVRVVKGMPKWIPGKIAGKAVHSIYNLPVSFKLSQ